MRHLIVMRHGFRNENDQLAENAPIFLRMMLEGPVANLLGSSLKLAILSSPVQIASETASIVADCLGGSVQVCGLLKSSNHVKPNMAGVYEKVVEMAAETDVLVLVTHYEYVCEFPDYFGRNYLETKFGSQEGRASCIYVIDCLEKSLTSI